MQVLQRVGIHKSGLLNNSGHLLEINMVFMIVARVFASSITPVYLF